MISVQQSEALLSHLQTFEDDGATVASLLFEGGRLSYPERRRMEYELGFSEPYTLLHESRVLAGMGPQWNAACRFLARLATRKADGLDPTLDLLWASHDSFAHLDPTRPDAPALDRLIAALVTVQEAQAHDMVASVLYRACDIVISGLQVEGFPASAAALEELCDGAMPACIGLGLVDIDWRG